MLSKKLMEVKTMATTEFGLRVRTELLKRNITNKQLADMLGISVLIFQIFYVVVETHSNKRNVLLKFLKSKKK